jgi:hypothetical protein
MINNNPPAPARCGFVPPYPGYAGCTRDKGHSGPCAHPYEAPEGACNCWLGHGGYGGDSYVREHCPVHGDNAPAPAEPFSAPVIQPKDCPRCGNGPCQFFAKDPFFCPAYNPRESL